MDQLRQRLEKLSAEQRARLQQRLSATDTSKRQLVAYLVLDPAAGADPAALRPFLAERLPPYMVPARYLGIDAVPLMPNGKVDRRALPEVGPAAVPTLMSTAEPVGQTETSLAQIWSAVLGCGTVGRHDDYFELGGDSILSIQIVSRAAQEGIGIGINQIFQNPTVASLAQVAKTATAAAPSLGAESPAGPVALTPIQHWLLGQSLVDAAGWNQGLHLEGSGALDESALAAALAAVINRHDALQLSFSKGAGGWQQYRHRLAGGVEIARVDLAGLSGKQRDEAIAAGVEERQENADLSRGPRLMVVLFTGDDTWRLWLGAHHLVVDNISWGILVADLAKAYQQAIAGAEVALPLVPLSFSAWAAKGAAYAHSTQLAEQRQYWQNQAYDSCAPLPVDRVDGANSEGAAATLVTALATEQTQLLLRQAVQAYNTKANELLLTAVVRTLNRWAGGSELLLGLEGHGREEIEAGIDLSATVGWFTSFFPVVFSGVAAAAVGEAIKAVKEQLRQVPQRGIGYGFLRYLNGEAQLAALPAPEVVFNYAGNLDQVLGANEVFKIIPGVGERLRANQNGRTNLLEINAAIEAGKLQIKLTYSKEKYQRETIETLADKLVDELQLIISHCTELDSGGFTPSDFPDAGLNQAELDQFIDGLG